LQEIAYEDFEDSSGGKNISFGLEYRYIVLLRGILLAILNSYFHPPTLHKNPYKQTPKLSK
jgi:hypothetical protein